MYACKLEYLLKIFSPGCKSLSRDCLLLPLISEHIWTQPLLMNSTKEQSFPCEHAADQRVKPWLHWLPLSLWLRRAITKPGDVIAVAQCKASSLYSLAVFPGVLTATSSRHLRPYWCSIIKRSHGSQRASRIVCGICVTESASLGLITSMYEGVLHGGFESSHSRD